ncbi:TPA: thioredoxin-disulfide reductase [Listeria monocytogenes]
MYDSIVIGSGPAGLTSAIYLSRSGLSNALINGPEPGGQLTTTTEVENFPGFPNGVNGPELISNMERQAKEFGTKFISSKVLDILNKDKTFELRLENNELVKTRSVIISTGASAKYLGIDGEIENIGKGVSACATCDGFFYKDKEVVVIGGGDTAMEEALFLTHFASKVTLIHRRNELRASKIMQERALSNEKIEWKLNYTPQKINANNLGVTDIEILNNATGQTENVVVEGIFIAIGHQPNTKFIKDTVLLKDNGYILTDGKSSKTSASGIFAAGDVQDDKYRQAITAAGSGAIAALDVEEYLNGL